MKLTLDFDHKGDPFLEHKVGPMFVKVVRAMDLSFEVVTHIKIIRELSFTDAMIMAEIVAHKLDEIHEAEIDRQEAKDLAEAMKGQT